MSRLSLLFAVLVLAPTVQSSFTSQYVQLCGVRHHIRDTGEVDPDGPVAILLHGFAGSTEAWDQVAPQLAAGGCRAIAFDRVGFGLTERPAVSTLPAPPQLPFADALADSLVSLVESDEQQPSGGISLPDPRLALAMGLRRPSDLAPRVPWEFTPLREDPYSSRFAVSRALWALIRDRLGGSLSAASGKQRPVFLVGHSAGGPLALRALAECAASAQTPLPRGVCLGGVALIAPAALDPRDDPEMFESDPDAPGMLDQLPLPAEVRQRAELELRVGAFRTIVGLPDAFGLQTARRIYEGRDLEEAVRGQMHARMRAPQYAQRVTELAQKYAAPIRAAPDDWDRALLNVYRADITATGGQEGLRGRELLAAARAAKGSVRGASPRILVATGDDDRVVLPRASRRVAELVGAERFEELAETGHLPMDERPEEVAAMLLDFFAGGAKE